MPEQEPQIRAVLFDAVGTLFRSRGTIGEIYRDVAAKHGFTANSEAIQVRFAQRMEQGQTPTNKAGWHSMVRSVFQDLGPFPEFDHFFEEVYEVFRTDRAWRCYPETRTVLNALRLNGYLMGVVSNFDARLRNVLGDLEIDTYFQVVVTPASSGWAKPERRIFLKATAALGVAPAEALFAGDDPRDDYEAASRAGLRSVLIDRTNPKSGLINTLPTLEGIFTLLGIHAEGADPHG